MRIDTRPRHENAPRPKEKSAPQFLQWLRGRRCACGGNYADCGGKIEAAHVPDPATKGIGTKSSDRYAIPLSHWCHSLQHNIGWPTYAASYLDGRDPRGMAEAYWKAWPGRGKWEAKNAQ